MMRAARSPAARASKPALGAAAASSAAARQERSAIGAVQAPAEETATAARRAGRTPWLILFFVLLNILPGSVAANVAGLGITPARLYLILITPIMLGALAGMRWRAADWFIFAFIGYYILAQFIKLGAGAMEPVGSYALDAGVVYVLFRTQLRSVEDILALLKLLTLLVILLGLLALPEAVMKYRYLQVLPAKFTGVLPHLPYDERLGMLRAAGPFGHPILYGSFCASFIIIAWTMAQTRARAQLQTLLVFGAGFLSLSSAAIGGAVIGVGLLIAERASRHIRKRAQYLLYGIAFIYVFLTVFSDRGPIKLIGYYFSFNSHNGYYRTLIWEHVMDDVWRSPLFGFVGDWTRPSWMVPSVDNYWLVTMMQGGVVSAVLLLTAIFLILRNLYTAPNVYAADRRRRRLSLNTVYLLTIPILCLIAYTVHFFGNIHSFWFMHLAIGASIAQLAGAAPEDPEALERPAKTDAMIDRRGINRRGINRRADKKEGPENPALLKDQTEKRR